MDRPRNEAFVEASDALSSEDALQRAQCTSNHTGLLLTDNHDSCNLKWMGEQDRAKGKSCIHRQPFVTECPRQEDSHEAGIAQKSGCVAQCNQFRQVGAPVLYNLLIGGLSNAGSVNGLSVCHQRVEWLGKRCANQKVQACDVELVAMELLINHAHTHERNQTSKGTILEQTSFVHGHKFAAKVLTTLLVE